MLFKCETVLMIDIEFDVEADDGIAAVRKAEKALKSGQAKIEMPAKAIPRGTLRISVK